jgi:hypothetical protein
VLGEGGFNELQRPHRVVQVSWMDHRRHAKPPRGRRTSPKPTRRHQSGAVPRCLASLVLGHGRSFLRVPPALRAWQYVWRHRVRAHRTRVTHHPLFDASLVLCCGLRPVTDRRTTSPDARLQPSSNLRPCHLPRRVKRPAAHSPSDTVSPLTGPAHCLSGSGLRPRGRGPCLDRHRVDRVPLAARP